MTTKTKKIKIGFDVDGVICDFTTEFLIRLREHLQEDISLHPTAYHFINGYMDYFELEIGKGLFGECNPYPEAQVWMNKILNDPRFEVYFITARGSENEINWTSSLKYQLRKDTYEWFAKYFPSHNPDNIFFTIKKDELIYDLGLKMFVEDRKDTAERLTNVCKSFLITRSWNTGELHDDCRRIGSLNELDMYLESFLKE